MSFQNLLSEAQKDFPKLQIKYKDQSLGMKILGKLLFFDSTFMTETTTTIGSTIYFPSESFINSNAIGSCITLMHELIHMADQKKISGFLFSLSYLLPQILVPFIALLFFFVNWYIVLPLMLLFIAPLPAFFRMHWEKRAYISSLYTTNLLSKRLNFNPHLDMTVKDILSYFQGPSYYFMWPFHDINKQFSDALQKVQSGQRPYDDPIFDILDNLVTKV